jgi:hypothetical protein
MQTMTRSTCRIVASVMIIQLAGAPEVAWALDGKKAAYMGGTFAAFSTFKDPVEGKLDTSGTTHVVFTPGTKELAVLEIPYATVADLEYGQKAGRRVGAAVGTTILLGPLGLLSLFSKKRRHYLTIGYKAADGTDQVAVLELGKDMVRTTLAVVEARSGKKIVYQDDEARKSGKGN